MLQAGVCYHDEGVAVNFLHKVLELADGDMVEVTLNNRANVQLLDEENYQQYSQNKLYRYHGGYGEYSPVILATPSAGRWHLVIYLGGGVGSVSASVRVLTAQMA